jgi:hypothetical protein
MRRIFAGSVVILVLSLAPHTGSAMPAAARPTVTAEAPLIFVEGWWERERRDDARDRYWRLTPEKRRQYDRFQAEANRRDQQRRRFEQQDNRAIQEQHRLLGY